MKKLTKKNKKKHHAVTQDMLEEYLALDHQLKALRTVQKALREKIRWALENGGMVEPGMATAFLTEHERRSLTWAKLADAVGPERAAKIRAHIEPTVVTSLQVRRKAAKGPVVLDDDPYDGIGFGG